MDVQNIRLEVSYNNAAIRKPQGIANKRIFAFWKRKLTTKYKNASEQANSRCDKSKSVGKRKHLRRKERKSVNKSAKITINC